MQVAIGALVVLVAMGLCSAVLRAPDSPELAEKLANLLVAWAAGTRVKRATYAKCRRMDIRMVDPEAKQ